MMDAMHPHICNVARYNPESRRRSASVAARKPQGFASDSSESVDTGRAGDVAKRIALADELAVDLLGSHDRGLRLHLSLHSHFHVPS